MNIYNYNNEIVENNNEMKYVDDDNNSINDHILPFDNSINENSINNFGLRSNIINNNNTKLIKSINKLNLSKNRFIIIKSGLYII